jgi:hypothetical protein
MKRSKYPLKMTFVSKRDRVEAFGTKEHNSGPIWEHNIS